MDTKPLERFATQARRDLLSSVDARATAVLAAGSVARAERPEVVRKLESEIAAHGRAHVIDKVAYTWFNRIIALRFMDARGYTDVGIVSPAQGQSHGQPEILAEAKRGNLDADVVNNKTTAETILSLLDGTRRSTDAEGEAYALLLTEYCRRWHKSMPFMFEQEGDYTELLVPAGLLADGAILSRARRALTEEVCDDVEVIGWLYQFYISERKDEVFASFKKNKKAGADEIPAATQLFTPHWIVRYLVQNSVGRLWMLNRPGSRLIDQMDYYIAPVDEETDFLRIAGPEELTVIDPACGSGHMLTYAFDLLYAIYEEAGYAPSEIPGMILTHNLHGAEIDPRAGALAAFALTMKARARQRTFFNMQIAPNICVLDSITFTGDEMEYLFTRGGDRNAEEAFWNQFSEADSFGSLIQPDSSLTASLGSHLAELRDDGDILKSGVIEWAACAMRQAEFLAPRYGVVVANPPYMGSKNMSAQLVDFAKVLYPSSKSDLYSMFIERNLALTVKGGFVAMITMQSWMFLGTFSALRGRVLNAFSMATMAHLGSGAFDTINGEVVATTAFVIRGWRSTSAGVYLGLSGLNGEATQSMAARAVASGDGALRHEVTSADFDELPLASMAYWLSPSERHIYRDQPQLGDLAETKQGLATGDNNRFLRFWWEVSRTRTNRDAASGPEAALSKARWFPVQKGGTARRWTGNDEYIVDWRDDGKEIRSFGTQDGGRPKSRAQNTAYYFREGATWSSLSGEFAMRLSPGGFIFETKGSMLFPKNGEDLPWLLGYLNTPIARELIDSLSPTLDYHEGPVARIPVIRPLDPSFVQRHVNEALQWSKEIWSRLEVSPSFKGSYCHRSTTPSAIRSLVAAEIIERLELEERVLTAEREIEGHFRASGGIGEDVFPLEEQRPTGLIDDALRDNARGAQLLVEDLVSYAVGCLFGRFSIDEPGLILADQGATQGEYLETVRAPTLGPDVDNVIPFVDDGWFEDDIVERIRQFLRVAFGPEHFEENVRFVEESLGVKTLRDYFITKTGKSKFYDDHLQRYKKRPIYWMFSSPKGSFNALIYMHRYNPSTVSTVLNEYLREYRAKLEVALTNADRAGAAGSSRDQKEADRLRKVLAELNDYEHDTLYPLATQQVAIDLDDGVKVNYPKFYPALRKIAGLEAAE